MPGGHEVGAELLAVRPELAELEPVVANHAGIRRAAGEIFVGKVIDDAVEVAFEIESVKRYVETVGDAPEHRRHPGQRSSPSCGEGAASAPAVSPRA